MIKKQYSTEQRIVDAARSVFVERGFAAARMKEIAGKAGLNQALLHYYFKNKDLLFERVFQDAVRTFFPLIISILESDKGIEEKMTDLVHTYVDFLKANPHVPGFLIHEVTQNPNRLTKFLRTEALPVPVKLIRQYQDGVAAGKYIPIDPIQLIVSVIAMCVFPFVARPMIQTVFGLDNGAFESFIENRKDQVTHFIINGMYR